MSEAHGRSQGARRSPRLRMLWNSMALSAGIVVRLSVGFLTWLVAARLYAAEEVGIAAGAISAMMLCVQAGMLGVDLALIAEYPRQRGRGAPLVDTAVTLGTLVSLAAGAIVIIVAAVGFRALDIIASSAMSASLFLGLTALQAVWWILDQASVALRRSEQVLVRATIAAGVTLAGVVLFGVLGAPTASAILTAWVIGAAITCIVGFVQLSRATGGYLYRPRLVRPLVRRLLRVGLPNFRITVADYTPGLVMPIVAAEVLSARVAAYWYVIWMMATAAYVIPAAFGLNLFAEAAAAPREMARRAREALGTALLIACAASITLALLGPIVLSILGSDYAEGASGALRILAFAAIPMVVVKVYLATCRSTGRMLEGTVAATAIGVTTIACAIVAAGEGGLEGIALTWLVIQTAGAVAVGARLRHMLADLAVVVPPGAQVQGEHLSPG